MMTKQDVEKKLGEVGFTEVKWLDSTVGGQRVLGLGAIRDGKGYEFSMPTNDEQAFLSMVVSGGLYADAETGQ